MNGIVLDTNVISEPKRPRPDPTVRAWFERQEVEQLFLTSTVICELAEGIERLPPGRRRVDFEGWLRALIEEALAGRIFVFGVDEALIFGRLAAAAYAAGRPPKMGDAQIAAVASANGMAVATRDVADLEAFGVPSINPWTAG